MTGNVQWARHGTSQDGLTRPAAHARPDSPLSAQGRLEAITLAGHLRAENQVPDIILSSPLTRAAETAAILAALLNATLAAPHELFTEWRAPDCVVGLTPAEYPPAYRKWKAQRTTQPESALPGGESLTALASRAHRANQQTLAIARSSSRILVISHRIFIGSVIGIQQGSNEPAELFTTATALELAPAQTWCPDTEGPR